jgi:hypothetical protein
VNVDGCRIDWGKDKPTQDEWNRLGSSGGESQHIQQKNKARAAYAAGLIPVPEGRWPANLILDAEAGAVLDGQAGDRPTGAGGITRSHPKENGRFGSHVERKTIGYGDTGGASRFFMQAGGLLSSAETIMEAWIPSLANTADIHSSLSKSAVDSALRDAVISASLAGSLSSEWKGHTTAATPIESRRLCVTAIMAILIIDGRYSPASLPTKPTEKHGLVSGVETNALTGTTTITVSHWKSDGSADPVMFSITPPSTALGEVASRFRYCPKASKADRDEGLEGFEASVTTFAAGTRLRNNGDGTPRNQLPSNRNNHPTVKPTDLMRWLCRLVTPTGGTVLDPFTGSGSTGKAARLEGFNFIGIEREPEYADIARARIAAIEPTLIGGLA